VSAPKCLRQPCHCRRGFTLIELVTVLAIAGILLAIAIPAFSEQLRKSRRGDAIAKLGDLVLRQERYRANNSSFGNCDQILSPATCAGYNSVSASPYYTFDAQGSPAGYTLTASPRGGSAQEGDRCGIYTFSMSNGSLSRSAVGGAACF
jgi:type IV pilus assembly protein PilE